ncbi:hypothetical protein JCM14036_16460 [Desulfotomaculum defluvii]
MSGKVKNSASLFRLYDLVFLQKIRDNKPSKEKPKKQLIDSKK